MDLELGDHLSSASRARGAVRRLVGSESASLDDALLLTSELVTNALLHGAEVRTLSGLFDPDADRLRIEVSDGSAVAPVMSPVGRPYEIGGHGLHLVDRLARSWGTTPTRSGKTVWFELGP